MAAEETGGSVCREAVMGGERADPRGCCSPAPPEVRAAPGRAPLARAPPWPGRHRWGLHAAVLPSRIVVTAMRSIDTEGPPRNGVCREMNHDTAHGFESKARLS